MKEKQPKKRYAIVYDDHPDMNSMIFVADTKEDIQTLMEYLEEDIENDTPFKVKIVYRTDAWFKKIPQFN